MVSAHFRESAYNPETDERWLVLATITHEDLTDPIRVVNDREHCHSNGRLYRACPFQIALPSDTEDGPPRARVKIDNVNQELTKVLRTITTAASISLQVVAASDPDTVEVEYEGLALRDVSVKVGQITGTIGLDDPRLEAFPSHSFSPSYFPGMF